MGVTTHGRAPAKVVPVLLAVVALTLTGLPAAVAQEDPPDLPAPVEQTLDQVPTTRVDGPTRFDTAVAISQASVDPVDVNEVLIASGANFPDALVAGPVAAMLGVPILLTEPTTLPASTAAEIDRLGVTTAHVLGGTAAIADDVVAAIEDMVPTVHRWSGPDRYATAAAIVDAFFDEPVRRVVVSTGRDFHDPLAAAAFGARGWTDDDAVHQHVPLLITDGGGDLEAPVRAAIERLTPGQIVVVGDPDAIGEDTRDELRRLASGRDENDDFLPPPRFLQLDPSGEVADTVGGTAADAASVLAVHSRSNGPLDRLVVATDATFADALTATPLAGRGLGGAVLYARQDCIPAAPRHVLAARDPDSEVVVVGGTAALSTAVEEDLRPCPPEAQLDGTWPAVRLGFDGIDEFPEGLIGSGEPGALQASTMEDGRVELTTDEPACAGQTDIGVLTPLTDLYGGVWTGQLSIGDGDCAAPPGPGIAVLNKETQTLALCAWPVAAAPRCRLHGPPDTAPAAGSWAAQQQGPSFAPLPPEWNVAAQIHASRMVALGWFTACIPLHNRARTMADVQLWVLCSAAPGGYLVASAFLLNDAVAAAREVSDIDPYVQMSLHFSQQTTRARNALADADAVVGDVLGQIDQLADILGDDALGDAVATVSEVAGVASSAIEGMTYLNIGGTFARTAAEGS